MKPKLEYKIPSYVMEALSCSNPIRKPPTLFLSSKFSLPLPTKPCTRPSLIARLSSSINYKARATYADQRVKASTSSQEPTETSSAGLDEECEKSRISEELRKETEEALEWPSICAQVSAFASTAAGRAACREARLRIGRDRKESQKLLDQTAAAVLLPEPLDFSGIDDVSEILRTAAAGELLGIRELCTVERSLRSARRVFEQLQQLGSVGGSSDRFVPLLDILQNCDFLTEIAQEIEFCINCTLCVVLDRASTKLESIRLERKANMEILESLLKEESMRVFQAGGIDSPLITKRRSRMCVGIKASHKSLLPEGVVLSASSSGATYFVEPRGAIKLNNMEVRLSNSERAEELAILGYLTSEIADSETKIRRLMEKIVELDLASARGAYAVWINGVCPFFNEDDNISRSIKIENFLSVNIEGIQHPLLLEPCLRSLSSVPAQECGNSIVLNQRDGTVNSGTLPEGGAPVPLDIKIGHATKVVVISGPNTGGKTASMKTLGLASLMSKAGMFLPAKNRPRIPWFDQILADVGDHQSLEHNLSTFSGHISRICRIIEVVSEESLVLIDEIGSGTDPSEGVALATSILQHLADHVNLAVVTTHYADLSRLKATDSRFENAAMEFCVETLQPTYRILWGSTGNSNALSIAKSIGFDQKVLDRAQEWVEKLVPDKQKERQGLLYQSLLAEKNLLEAQARDAASVLSEVKKLYLEIYSEAEDLDRREASLMAKETYLLQQQLKLVKSQMDAIIKDFENRLQSTSPDEFNAVMRESEAAIASIVAAHQPSEDMLFGQTDHQSSYVPQIGDKVYLKGLGDKIAIVVEAPAEDGTAMVQYGKMRMRVKRNDMKLIQGSMKNMANSAGNLKMQDQQHRHKRAPKEANKDVEVPFGPAVRTSKNTVDLRGMRVEEAAHQLQMAISASKSYNVLFIVHGMGTGAVKDRVLDILKSHPRIVKLEEESPMNYGCTVAYIK